MCGIVGVFLKNKAKEPQLGSLLAGMLAQMTERGPDSAGFAIYGDPAPMGAYKVTLFHPDPGFDWRLLDSALDQEFGLAATPQQRGSHRVVTVRAEAETLRQWLARHYAEIRPMGFGERIEIFKEKGLPDEVIASFDLAAMGGSHALGHTRMATESAVTTEHSHPFSTGVDLCLVHNGSLSNHNRLRQTLRRRGIHFTTDNDSEVAAGYLSWRMSEGASLKEALEAGLKDLDGFYTFAVGTRDGFAILRDPIACKPAVMGETDDWVAMATEYRAIATLPGADRATIWEPRAATVYSWERQ
ncbi:MAG TPA: glutamine amidotransferase family protein [Stellaceae bacterium]|nr:glutamine amidotransferase family protein [Stellaceae bacterium]